MTATAITKKRVTHAKKVDSVEGWKVHVPYQSNHFDSQINWLGGAIDQRLMGDYPQPMGQ